MDDRSSWLTRALLAVLLAGLPIAAALALDRAAGGAGKPIAFIDVPSQAAEFIGYSRSITLTPAQKRLRDRALGAIAAPCCSKFSAATCCCPCNLAKTVWGLTNHLIVHQGADVASIQKAARRWIRFVNPKGFSGDACNTPGGCGRAFSSDGCGGMDERNLVAAR